MEEKDVHNLVKAIKQYTSQLHQNLEISKMNHLNSGRGEAQQVYSTTTGQTQQQPKLVAQPNGGGITPKRESFSSQLSAALSNENLQRRILFEPSNASNTRNTYNSTNLQSLSPIASTPSRKSHVIIDPTSGMNDVPSRFADKQHFMRQNHTKQRHREPRSHALSLYEQGQLIQQQYESQNEEIQDEFRYNSQEQYELPQKQLEQKPSGVFNLRKQQQQQSPNYSQIPQQYQQYNHQQSLRHNHQQQQQQPFQDLNIDGQNDLCINRMLLQEQFYSQQADPSRSQLLQQQQQQQQSQKAFQRIDEIGMIPARRLAKTPNDLHSRSQIILSSSPIIQNENSNNNLEDNDYFQLHSNQHASQQSHISRKYLLQQQEQFEQKQQEKQQQRQFELLEEQKLQQQRKQQQFQSFKQHQSEFMRKQLEIQLQQQQQQQLQSQEEANMLQQQQACVSSSCNNISSTNRLIVEKNNQASSSRNSSFLTPKVSSSQSQSSLPLSSQSQQQQILQQQQQQSFPGFSRKALLASSNSIALSDQTKTPKIQSQTPPPPEQSFPKQSLQISQFSSAAAQRLSQSINSPHYMSNYDDEQEGQQQDDRIIGQVEEDFLFRQHLTNMPSPISQKNKISQQQIAAVGGQMGQISQQNNKSNEFFEYNQNKDNSYRSSSNNQRDLSMKRNSMQNIQKNTNIIAAQPIQSLEILNHRFSQGALLRQPSPQQVSQKFSKRNDKTPPKSAQEEDEDSGPYIQMNKPNILKRNEEQSTVSYSDRLPAINLSQPIIPSKSIISEYEKKISELESDMIKSREEKRSLELQLDDYKLAVAALARQCKILKGEMKANDLKPQVSFYKQMLTSEQKVSRELKEDNIKLKKQLLQVVRLVQAYSSEETEDLKESEQERMELAVRVQYLTEILQISAFNDDKASELAERLQREEEKQSQQLIEAQLSNKSASVQQLEIYSSSNKNIIMKQLQDVQKERERQLQQLRIQQENAAGNGSPFGMNQASILNSHKNTDMLDLYEDKNIEQTEQTTPLSTAAQQPIPQSASDQTNLQSSNSPSSTEDTNYNNNNNLSTTNNPFSPNSSTSSISENSSNSSTNSSSSSTTVSSNPIKPKSMISGMSVLGSGMSSPSPSPTPMTINVSSFFSASASSSSLAQPSSSTFASQQSLGIPNALKQSLKSGKSIFNSITTLTANSNKANPTNNSNTNVDLAAQHPVVVLNTAPSIGSSKKIASISQSPIFSSQKNIIKVGAVDQSNLQTAGTTPKSDDADGIQIKQQNPMIKPVEVTENEGNNYIEQVNQGTIEAPNDRDGVDDDDNQDHNEIDRSEEEQNNSPQEEEGEENEQDELQDMLDNSEDDTYNILEDTTDQSNSTTNQLSKKADESSLEKDYKQELQNNPPKFPESNQSTSSLAMTDNTKTPQDLPSNAPQSVAAKPGIISSKPFFISSSSAFSFQSNLQSQITKPKKDELNDQVIVLSSQGQTNNAEMINCTSTSSNNNLAVPGMKAFQNSYSSAGIAQNLTPLGSTKKEETESISFKIPFNKKY